MVIGPNTFGVATSGVGKIGVAPNKVFTPGPVGVVSRSGTLTYEILAGLQNQGIGSSTVIGLGGDRVTGLNFVDMLRLFGSDNQTEVVVMIGEIGGSAEEDATAYIHEKKYPKPVIAYLAGKSASPGKRMGHAGAIYKEAAPYDAVTGVEVPSSKTKSFLLNYF